MESHGYTLHEKQNRTTGSDEYSMDQSVFINGHLRAHMHETQTFNLLLVCRIVLSMYNIWYAKQILTQNIYY